jgi:hypothetical protein
VFTSAAAAREELQPFVTADRKVSRPFFFFSMRAMYGHKQIRGEI